ncbi:MAG: hypothetical protein HY716_10400 [Planctomycetes bacterium]|nr:hypothetical protein [Planctomycetota bacterium]
MKLKEALLAPLHAATLLMKITGRIALGVAGFLLMSGGLLLIEPYGLLVVGLPLVFIGLICVVRAIF